MAWAPRAFIEEIHRACATSVSLLQSGHVFTQDHTKALLLHQKSEQALLDEKAANTTSDQVFSFRAAFGGIVLSFIDSTPAEVCVGWMKNVNLLSRWNSSRSSDASLMLSVGWLQVDNHVPSAPFPVALRPIVTDSQSLQQSDLDNGNATNPLLMVAVTVAPRHSSGIMVSPLKISTCLFGDIV